MASSSSSRRSTPPLSSASSSSSLPPMFRKVHGVPVGNNSSGAPTGLLATETTALDWPQNSMRSLKTKRPFTPREKERKLFVGRWSNSGGLSSSLNAGTSQKYFSGFAKIDENFDHHLPEVRPNTSGKGPRGKNDDPTKLPDIIPSERELRKQFRTTEPPLQVASDQYILSQQYQKQPKPQQQQQQVQQQPRIAGLAIMAPPLEAPAPAPPKPADDLALLLEKLDQHLDVITQEEYLKQLKAEILSSKLSSATKKSILGVIAKIIEKNASTASTILSLDILLILKVTKANFLLSSKLFFHFASSDENDNAILENDILDHYLYLLGRSCPQKDQEAMLYGYGALKFLSFNPTLLKSMLNHGLVDLLVLHIKFLCSSGSNSSSQEEEEQPSRDEVPGSASSSKYNPSTSVFQMTSCLRNCLNSSSGKKAFLGLHGHLLLLLLVERFLSNEEIMCNVARIFSVLSMESELTYLHHPDVINTVLGMIERHDGRYDIIVRTAFYLGNVAAKEEPSRVFISAHPSMQDKVPQVLLRMVKELLDSATSSDNHGRDQLAAEAAPTPTVLSAEEGGILADTIVKLLRVFANISINPHAGELVAINEPVLSALVLVLGAHREERFGDILLPALSTLNNLSYYPIVQHGNLFRSIRPIVFHDDEAVSAEALRVLGNLSRSKETRDELRTDKFFKDLFERMTWDNREVKFSSAGIVVNLLTDRQSRPFFKSQGGFKLCLGLLDGMLQSQDWALASLICQILWNYSIHAQDAGDALTQGECDELERSLIGLLDMEMLGGDKEEEEEEEEGHFYGEFSAVGFHLLSKLCNGPGTE